MTQFVRRRSPSDAAVPDDVAASLDASAEDLRHNRLEDAGAYLRRVQAKVEAYKSGRSTSRNGTEER